MLTWTFGLLLAGAMLMLGGGYAYGNATQVATAGLAPPAVAAVRRQQRFYVGCMALAGAGVLSLCGAIVAFAVMGTEAGTPVLAGAGTYAAAGAVAAACGALRLLG